MIWWRWRIQDFTKILVDSGFCEANSQNAIFLVWILQVSIL